MKNILTRFIEILGVIIILFAMLAGLILMALDKHNYKDGEEDY